MTEDTTVQKKPSVPTATPDSPEAAYSANELMKAARVKFGCMPEVVGAALKYYGMSKATVTETQKLVEKFKNREVR